MRGWLILLLIIGFTFRAATWNASEPTAKASTPPVVVTIEDESSPAASELDSQPVVAVVTIEPAPLQRVVDLEVTVENHESFIVAQKTLNEVVDNRLNSMDELLTRCVGLMENTQRHLLQMMQQSTDEPKSVVSSPGTQVPPISRILTMITDEGCLPCARWKLSPDRRRIEAEGYTIAIVGIDDLPPDEPRPPVVPSFKLTIGDLCSRQAGPITYARFKDMERAILETVRN